MNEAERIEGFRKELAALVNRFSLESIEGGNVPDHILADVMVNAMLSFNMNHKAVCKWYGVELEPGNKRFTDSEDGETEKKPEAAIGFITMPGRQYVQCGRCGSAFFDDYIKVGKDKEKQCPVCGDYNNFIDVPKAEGDSPWETPEQYQKRMGKPWPDNAPVYALYQQWFTQSYGFAKMQMSKNATERLLICVTAAGRPPDCWRPQVE